MPRVGALVALLALSIGCGGARGPGVGSDASPDTDAIDGGDGASEDGDVAPAADADHASSDALPVECGDTSPSCPDTAIDGDVTVRDEAGYCAVARVRHIGGSLTFSAPRLDRVAVRPCFATVEGDVNVVGNDRLPSLMVLENLSAVGGDLRIARNRRIVDLNGLGVLVNVGGVMTIGGPGEGDGNASLERFDGIDGLNFVGGLVVEGNPVLLDVGALSNLDYYGGACDLTIRRNPALTSLFQYAMISLPAGIAIEDNASLLDDCEPMRDWGMIEGSVTLRGLPSLRGLSMFEGAGYVGGDLVIRDTGVESLAGLGSLATIGGSSVSVVENAGLPTCEAEALRDRFVAFGWTGTAEIRGNDDLASCE
jgi:hypothetical protein